MANAPIDQNHVATALGVWCGDGTTLIPIAINESNNSMTVDTTSTVSYTPTPWAPRDDNRVVPLLYEGSDGQLYPVNVNADGAVLIST